MGYSAYHVLPPYLRYISHILVAKFLAKRKKCNGVTSVLLSQQSALQDTRLNSIKMIYKLPLHDDRLVNLKFQSPNAVGLSIAV